MIPMPEVSVIVPTHNRASLISQTLESVASQTFSNWECLVVDDGSTDETEEVVAAFVARDARFRYYRQENAGASSARNAGLALAQGRFVTFLDSDDLLEPDKLEWQVAALDSDPNAVLVYGLTYQFAHDDPERGGIYMGDRRDMPAGQAFEQLIACSSIYVPLVRTSSIRSLGGFDTSLPSAEDWDMWLSLAKLGTICFEPRIALKYRLHSGNKSGNTLRNYRCACRVVSKQLRGVAPLKRFRLKIASWRYFRRGYTRRLLEEASRRSVSGQRPEARELWLAVLGLDPLLIRRRRVLINGFRAFLSPWLLRSWGTIRGRSRRLPEGGRNAP